MVADRNSQEVRDVERWLKLWSDPPWTDPPLVEIDPQEVMAELDPGWDKWVADRPSWAA